MSYSKDFYVTAADVDRTSWEQVVPSGTVSMSLEYLELIESLHRPNVDFHYAIIRKDGEPVGAIYFQTITFLAIYLRNFLKIDESPNIVWKSLLKVISWFLRFWSWNLILSGNIFFTGERGVYFLPSVPKPDATALLKECFEWIRKNSRIKTHGYMLNNVYDADGSGIHDFLREERWSAFPVDPDMLVNIRKEWGSMEDYSASLQSKYRVRMRKVMEVSRPIEVKDLSEQEVLGQNEKIYELYLATANKAAFNLGNLAPDYFKAMKVRFGSNFRILAYYYEGRMVGFMSALCANRNLDANYMGLDYSLNQDLKLYNRMLYDLIEKSIEMDCEWVHLGRTATEIKSTIGAEPRPMHIYLSSQTAYKREGMRYFEPYFGSPEYVIRHPFKALNS